MSIRELEQGLDDPRFPGITYRRGAAGFYEPVIRGTGLHVRTLVVAHHVWNLSVSDIADGHDLAEEPVLEALAFFEAHRSEIEAAIAEEQQYEPKDTQQSRQRSCLPESKDTKDEKDTKDREGQ